MTNLNQIAQEYSDEGMTKDEVLAHLMLEHKLALGAAQKIVKEIGLTKTRSNSIAAQYYELLETNPTWEEAWSFLLDFQSDNVVKHKSHYQKIWEMANSIHRSYQ